MRMCVKGWLVLLMLCFLVYGCGSNEMEFDPKKWNHRPDISYTYRKAMVQDLMHQHLNQDMSYEDVTGLLGPVDPGRSRLEDSLLVLSYEIFVEYGPSIHPKRGEDLVIRLSEDSLVVDYRLRQWERGQ
ncbi:hypothetical protein QLX67_13095 [Balneolaceae bacterium ANBcel3]|nr:hypothetical protein [Balneolaceae bacterium ANBcel3]